jgi:hypothetical protein
MSRVLALKECGSTPGPQNNFTVASVPLVKAANAELICPVVAIRESGFNVALVADPDVVSESVSLHPWVAAIVPTSKDAINKKKRSVLSAVVFGSGRMEWLGYKMSDEKLSPSERSQIKEGQSECLRSVG